MPKDWYLKIEGDEIVLYKGQFKLDRSGLLGGKPTTSTTNLDLGGLVKVEVSDGNKLKFTFTNGSPRPQSLDDFAWEQSSFSRKFQKAKKAKEFVSIWFKHVAPFVTSSGKYSPSKATRAQSYPEQPIPKQQSSKKDSTPAATPLHLTPKRKSTATAMSMLLPVPKKRKDDDGLCIENHKNVEECYAGSFEVPISCLKAPAPARCLREPDRTFIESLKEEMIQNPTSLVSPIVALVRLGEGDTFDNQHPQGYMYETIGGNNSRIALQELLHEKPDVASFQTRLIAVYVGLTDEQALMLASKHNRATSFTHSMTTQDKVILCRKRYLECADKQEWRKQCSTMLCEPLCRLDDSMILALATLPDEEYCLLTKVFEKFEKCQIKEQILSRSKRGQIAKLDCKGSYFMPLRAMDEEPRRHLLQQLVDRKISFLELSNACKYAKKMRAIQRAFMSCMHLLSWEDAVKTYPEQTSREKLEPFSDLPFNKAHKIPPSFVAYCQHSKRMLAASRSESTDAATDIIKTGNITAVLFQQDVLSLHTESILKTLSPHAFSGFNLTLLDPPDEWKIDDFQCVFRLVRSVNITQGLQTFTIAVFASSVEPKLRDSENWTTQIVYVHNKSVVNTDSHLLAQSVTPVILYHWTSTGDIPCYPPITGNLLTVNGKGVQSKAQVYKALVELLTIPDQWVFDPLCGVGKISESAVSVSRSVYACDTDENCLASTRKQILEAMHINKCRSQTLLACINVVKTGTLVEFSPLVFWNLLQTLRTY